MPGVGEDQASGRAIRTPGSRGQERHSGGATSGQGTPCMYLEKSIYIYLYIYKQFKVFFSF